MSKWRWDKFVNYQRSDEDDLMADYEDGLVQIVFDGNEVRYVPIHHTVRIPIPDKK